MELASGTPTTDLTTAFLANLGPRITPRTYGPSGKTPSSLASGMASVSAPAPSSVSALTSAPNPAPGSEGFSLTHAFLGASSPSEGSVQSTYHHQISLPPVMPPRYSTLLPRPRSESAISRANSGVSLSDAGPLQQAVYGHNLPLLDRLQEREQREVYRNVYECAMPKPFLLEDQPRRPEPPVDRFGGRALLSHSDLVRRCADGYRAPPGASPALVSLIDDAVAQAAVGLAKSSGSKYARMWKKFENWVSEYTVGLGRAGDPLTAFEACSRHEIIAAYLTHLVANSGSISSAQSTLSSLQYYVGLTNVPFHQKSFLDAVMKGLKRQYAKVAEKVQGFTTGQVADLLHFVLWVPKGVTADEGLRLRLAALIIVCYFCAARNEEALGLRFIDINHRPSGNLVVNFTKGKTNQFKQRFETVIKDGFILGTEIKPVSVVLDYLRFLNRNPGGPPVMLFPQYVSKGSGPGQPRVSGVKGDGSIAIKYDYCRKLLNGILDTPDFKKKHDLGSGKYGWHSFRGGSLSAQAGKGVPLHLIQQQARHANVGTTLGYVNAVESEKSRASAALLADMELPCVPDTSMLEAELAELSANEVVGNLPADGPDEVSVDKVDVATPPSVEGEGSLDIMDDENDDGEPVLYGAAGPSQLFDVYGRLSRHEYDEIFSNPEEIDDEEIDRSFRGVTDHGAYQDNQTPG